MNKTILERNQENFLKKIYKKRETQILRRLKEFKNAWSKDDEYIFAELCFCILTPQSNAKACNEIINNLKDNNLLYKGKKDEIIPYIKRARFYKKKSKFIIEARSFFEKNNRIKIKNTLNINNIKETRNWLVKNIKGIGLKEASHFLRNIGFGEELAILDIHVLRNLKRYNVISSIPQTLNRKKYLKIEKDFKEFSKNIKIPLSHLDLLFWSIETGEIFK